MVCLATAPVFGVAGTRPSSWRRLSSGMSKLISCGPTPSLVGVKPGDSTCDIDTDDGWFPIAWLFSCVWREPLY